MNNLLIQGAPVPFAYVHGASLQVFGFIIARKPIYIDCQHWRSSRFTLRALAGFFGISISAVHGKIKAGEFILCDLNERVDNDR